MDEKIKELASDNVLMSAYLLLVEAKQIKASLAVELQAAKDDRRTQDREFREFMNEMWKTLRKIQAQFRIEAQLLNLVRPEEAGEMECRKSEGESNSSQTHTLKEFARRTH